MTLAGERCVLCDDLPAVHPHASRSKHRVVLPVLLCGTIRLEGVLHRVTRERPLLDTAIDFRHFQADALQNCRNNVYRMTILIADFASRLNSFWPRDHHRAAGAPGMRVAFEHLKGSREGGCPTGRVM